MKIILCKGLPASGKSTWALEEVAKNPEWIRINNDDISTMLYGVPFGKCSSSVIDKARKRLIKLGMESAQNIIVDCTNLDPKHERYVEKLITEYNVANPSENVDELYQLEIKDFTDVSLVECLKRNKERERRVPEFVIRKMYYTHIFPNQVNPQDPSLPKAAVFDIDGTIAIMTNRSPYDATKYYDDAPLPDMIELIKMYKNNNHHIIFLTGRTEQGRADTERWLADKCDIPVGTYTLIMRPTGDKTRDVNYKKDAYITKIKENYYVPIWFEDRIRNVEMARSLGINAVQVGEGDF